MPRNSRRVLFAGLMLLAAPSLPAQQTDTVYDRVGLSVSAEQQVANDVLVAVLFAERSGGDQARLADEVNRAIRKGLDRAARVAAVSARTLGYHTWPQYKEQVLRGWRVRQSIRLESRDGEALAALLGDLQQDLAIESVGYTVSPEARAEAENTLIARALASFRARAELVAGEMQRGGYRLVHIDVNTGGGRPQPMLMRGAAMAMESAQVAPPALEAGDQTITVDVSGTVELLPGN